MATRELREFSRTESPYPLEESGSVLDRLEPAQMETLPEARSQVLLDRVEPPHRDDPVEAVLSRVEKFAHERVASAESDDTELDKEFKPHLPPKELRAPPLSGHRSVAHEQELDEGRQSKLADALDPFREVPHQLRALVP